MIASSTFSLGAGTRKDDFLYEGRSVTDICLASSVRWCIGRIGPGDQMTILPKDSLCLQMPRVMQRFKQQSEQALSRGFFFRNGGLGRNRGPGSRSPGRNGSPGKRDTRRRQRVSHR
jgi:hypothetical protein